MSHYTKGHTQLHKPITTFYLTQKECALDWFMNEKQEWYTDERIVQILKLWESDTEFHSELLRISLNRKKQFKIVFDEIDDPYPFERKDKLNDIYPLENVK